MVASDYTVYSPTIERKKRETFYSQKPEVNTVSNGCLKCIARPFPLVFTVVPQHFEKSSVQRFYSSLIEPANGVINGAIAGTLLQGLED